MRRAARGLRVNLSSYWCRVVMGGRSVAYSSDPPPASTMPNVDHFVDCAQPQTTIHRDSSAAHFQNLCISNTVLYIAQRGNFQICYLFHFIYLITPFSTCMDALALVYVQPHFIGPQLPKPFIGEAPVDRRRITPSRFPEPNCSPAALF